MAQVQDVINGNLGRVGKLNATASGLAVVNISVVATPRLRNQAGEWVDDEAIWTDVTLWGPVATNFVNANLPLGTPLVIIGTRKARKAPAYTNQQNIEVPARVEQTVNASSIAVEITRFVTVTGTEKVQSQGQGQSQQQAPARQQAPAQQQAPATQKSNDIFNDEDSSDIFGSSSASDDSDDIFNDSDF